MVLEMTLEEQMERIRGRHEGSENAVDMMKVKQDYIDNSHHRKAVPLLRSVYRRSLSFVNLPRQTSLILLGSQ